MNATTRAKLTRLLTFLLVLLAIRLAVRQRWIVINSSPSVPTGLYIRCSQPPAVGRLVDFAIPPRGRDYLQRRTGKPVADWFILKPIVAGSGDLVDTTGGRLLVNGTDRGPMTTHDSAGNPLPVWREKQILERGEYFVYSNVAPQSFDSRHFGPVLHREIESVRVPLLLWD